MLNIKRNIHDMIRYKTSPNDTKIHIDEISNVIIAASFVSFISFVINYLGWKFIIFNELYSLNSIISLIELGFQILLFLLFFIIRNKLKKSSNSITINLYDLWGIIIFIMPLLQLIVLIITWFLGYGDVNITSMPLISADCKLISYSSLLIGMFVTGIMINDKLMVYASVLLLVLNPILLIFICAVNSSITSYEEIYSIISKRSEIGSIIHTFTFFALGLYLKYIIDQSK